jgi:polyferredoxin
VNRLSPEAARCAPQPLAFHLTAPRAAQTVSPRCEPAATRPDRKRFVRRSADRTQLIRHSIQAAFLLLNFWIGARFYFFVRYFETGGQTAWVPRPAGVEGWLPIAGLMTLKQFLLTARVPGVHPAALFLLLAFASISLVFRKAFCGWLCPVGTVSEWLWQGGREIFGRNFAPPRRLDVALRSLKYMLLFLFVYAVGTMSVGDIRAFMESPYGLIADVKMLDFFRTLGTTAAAVLAVLVVASVFVQNAWCRYLCPYGALMGLVSLLSPTRVRRDADACIDCGKCARVCPSQLPVDERLSVRSPECTACLECVSACPVQAALDLCAPRRRPIAGWLAAAGIVTIFLAVVGYAMLSGHWQTNLPASSYFELIPNAAQFAHPGY